MLTLKWTQRSALTVKTLIFKYRGLLWGIFGVSIILFPVYYSTFRMLLALPLLILGQLLRFWAAGVIPKYRTLELNAPLLVTYGPYAWIRNPLYAGNALIGGSLALMLGWWWCVCFAALYFTMYNLVIIPYEEDFLLVRFKDDYLAFAERTPRMIPDISRLKEKIALSPKNFDIKQSWFMERHSLMMNVIVAALVLLRLGCAS